MTAHPYMRRLGRRRLDGGAAAFWAYGFADEVGPAAVGWETVDMGPATASEGALVAGCTSSSVARFWDKLAAIRGYGVAAPLATGSEKAADRATKPRKRKK